MRYADIKDQLERYGGEPDASLLPILDIITDINDDMQHGRALPVIKTAIGKGIAELESLRDRISEL